MSPETEQLAKEVAEMAGESTDEAIHKALEERRLHLVPVIPAREPEEGERDRWMKFLQEEVWPKVKPEFRGRSMSKKEMDEIVGYASDDE
ncbi:MAG TPA: type II toxin-antitoxin system VapB family antitoxin [Thermoanaerobaculia bacterium]